MTGKKVGRKRFWSDDEKRSICVQTQAPGVSVAQVARRYAMNANLIHKWLRDPLFVPVRADDDERGEENTTFFLPVEIEGMASSPTSPHQAASPPAFTLPTFKIATGQWASFKSSSGMPQNCTTFLPTAVIGGQNFVQP